jgi:pyruvate/2-oxoglutarate dehydrogenase complex dihydrolipoamide dehydrogenase (E3) component
MLVRLNTEIRSVARRDGVKLVRLRVEDFEETIEVDEILAGVGRAPDLASLGLELAGVKAEPQRGILVDDRLCTSNERIYAAGDVCLETKFTHMAEATGRLAAANALGLGRERLGSLVIPWCTYTDPEIAHVGLYVREAREQNLPVETYTIPLTEVDRAVTDGEVCGFVKITVASGTDRILGATIVGRDAGEMLSELTLAIAERIGLCALARVIRPYPTKAEAVRRAAEACARKLRRPVP